MNGAFGALQSFTGASVRQPSTAPKISLKDGVIEVNSLGFVERRIGENFVLNSRQDVCAVFDGDRQVAAVVFPKGCEVDNNPRNPKRNCYVEVTPDGKVSMYTCNDFRVASGQKTIAITTWLNRKKDEVLTTILMPKHFKVVR